MANQLASPEWITSEALEMFEHNLKFAQWQHDYATDSYRLMVAVPKLPPMDTRTLLALGAAAVIASPRKLSRRALLALGWKSR